MESRDVERWQAAQIRESLQPSLRYLGRLQKRMEEVGFLPSDRLLTLVREAYNSMHHLSVELHYLSCKGGVGREPRKKE